MGSSKEERARARAISDQGGAFLQSPEGEAHRAMLHHAANNLTVGMLRTGVPMAAAVSTVVGLVSANLVEHIMAGVDLAAGE